MSLAMKSCLDTQVPTSSKWRFSDWPWKTDAWVDVTDLFGEAEAGAILEEFESMREAFFSIRTAHPRQTVVEETLEISTAFQKQFPEAPV